MTLSGFLRSFGMHEMGFLLVEREKATLKGKITRLETFVESVAEPISEDIITELEVKLETVCTVKRCIAELQKDYFKFPVKVDISEAETDLEEMEISSEKNRTPDVKLPKLNLSTFTGNVYEWITFNDLFKVPVHNNDDLSKGQKLQYLLSALKGDALRVVKSIAVLDQNYEVAWSLLE
ncbi:uncharacterized protein LOC118199648 [Stegodyphus dumicola]|uniref:uncharacterized protein LOC118199648 n=1 Tax=Stegodyphus dumicola TaxID=202533 RepID=UPI0015AACA0E|nr:uncharacterized protein LOC118199648 [Stegodyphus dumicola]